MPNSRLTPDAVMFLTSHCPHCPAVLGALGSLVKANLIGRLEVVNLESHPERAETLGVRGVPWVQLGEFELDGLRSESELRHWAKRAGTPEGMCDYLRELLQTGMLSKVVDLVRHDHALFAHLPDLLADPDSDLPVRVGIGAVFEEFEGQPPLAPLVPKLGALTRHHEPHLRADAAHLLALTRERNAIAFIEPLLNDPAEPVREVAQEAIETLRSAGL